MQHEDWCMLDNIISKTLHNELGNKDYNQWLNESSQVISNICMRIYGVNEKNNKPLVKKNRRQRMMQNLIMKRNKKKKKLIRFANTNEKEGLLAKLQRKTKLLVKQKILGRDGWNEGKSKNVFPGTKQYARSIFDQPKSGLL